jgi:DNA-binding NarL/FixJ family response regulator
VAARWGRKVVLQSSRRQDHRRQLPAAPDPEGHHGSYESLSERQREVFRLSAEGHSNKAIASTVETRRAHIFQKLDLHNTAELVMYAVRRGVIS